MMTALEIRQLLQGGGSETGIHFYMKVATCPAQAIFEKEAAEQGDYQYSVNREAGSVFHALRRQYHDKQEITIPKEDPDGDLTITTILAEAHRAFDFYRSYMPIDHIGSIIGQEIELRAEMPGAVSPFTISSGPIVLTGMLDVVVEVGAKADDSGGTRVPGLVDPIGPGLYLWDDKTHEKKPSHLFVEDSHSLQFVAYHWLWTHCDHPMKHLPLQGTLVHHLVRHKDIGGDFEGRGEDKKWVPNLGKSVIVTHLPPPIDEEYQRLFNFVAYAKHLEILHQETGSCYNVAACNNFAGCPFRTNGRCHMGAKEI